MPVMQLDFFNNTGPKFGDSTKPNSKWCDRSPSRLVIIDIGDAGREVTFRFVCQERSDFKKTSSPAKAIRRAPMLYGEVYTIYLSFLSLLPCRLLQKL